jgi:hypothetical protein
MAGYQVTRRRWLTTYPEERIDTMVESLTDLMLCDEETLSQELPDAALEVAAGKYWEVGNPFTPCILLRIGHLPLLRPH